LNGKSDYCDGCDNGLAAIGLEADQKVVHQRVGTKRKQQIQLQNAHPFTKEAMERIRNTEQIGVCSKRITTMRKREL